MPSVGARGHQELKASVDLQDNAVGLIPSRRRIGVLRAGGVQVPRLAEEQSTRNKEERRKERKNKKEEEIKKKKKKIRRNKEEEEETKKKKPRGIIRRGK